MTDVLINDKPQFVQLFTENSLNIVDFLTYGKLEELYRSIPDSTLLYQLLQRRLVARLGTTTSAPAAACEPKSPKKLPAENIQNGPMTDITLFEVSLQHLYWILIEDKGPGDETLFCFQLL